MKPETQSLVRAALKIIGGYFVAHGIADDSTLEIIISGLAALIGVVWGYVHRADSSGSGSIGGRVPCLLPFLLLGGLVTGLCTGCTVFRNDLSLENKNGDKRRSRTIGYTFFDGKSALSKLKTVNTEKTQGVGIDGLENESSGTNAVIVTENVLKGLAILGATAVK